MMTARLMFRRHRWTITSWSVLLVALAGVTVSAYQTTYTTPEQRQTATELAQHDAASTLLYGALAAPGTPALMFTWEIGAIATILVAIVAVLLAVSLTRAVEDDGTMEILRSGGIGPRVPLRSALAVIALMATIVTVGCTVAVGLNAGRVDAVTWPGALAFGCVIGLTFLLTAVITLVLAQVAPTTTDARLLGFTTVAAAFATRAFADTQHVGWLNWLSPLALRATVRPFLSNRWWVLTIYLLLVLVLGALAETLSDRREYGAGLMRRRDRHDARLNVHSSLGLARRLARRSIITWTVAVAAIGTVLCAMGSGVVQQSQDGDVGGFLGSQLGTGDPIAGYFAYCGTLVGLMVSAFAVLCVLGARQDERIGHTDHLLTTGRRRWEPLAAQLVVTAAGSAIILLVTGVLSAVVAPTAITGTDVALRAFGYTVGQWPAVIAAAGWTALLIGRSPRWHWLAWAPLLVGGTLALLGDLLSIPDWIQTLGIFQHVPDLALPGTNAGGPLVLITAAGTACLLGVIGTTQRDVAAG